MICLEKKDVDWKLKIKVWKHINASWYSL